MSTTTENKFIEKLYLDAETADVFFIVEDGNGGSERIPGHKCLLAAMSDVFKAMLYGPMKKEEDIRLSHVTPHIFKILLHFVYLKHVILSMGNVMRVLALGHMYNIVPCIDSCVDTISKNLTNANVCYILANALLFNLNRLEVACTKRIAFHSRGVLKSKGFLDCSKDTLRFILRMNTLSCSETEVFEACLVWILRKSKRNKVTKKLIREHLGELFYQIRFVAMEPEEFAKLSMRHGYAFSVDEHMDIVQGFQASSDYPKMFEKTSRHVPFNEDCILVCDLVNRKIQRVLWATVDRSEYHECCTFTTNTALLLGGFSINEILVSRDDVDKFRGVPSELTIEVHISQQETEDNESKPKIISNFTFEFRSNGRKSGGIDVALPVPIIVVPGYKYKIRAQVFPSKPDILLYRSLLLKYEHPIIIDRNIEIKVHDNIFRGTFISLLKFNKLTRTKKQLR